MAQIVETTKAKTWNGAESEGTGRAAELRAALPDFIAEGIDRDGFFQRRTGKCFAERVDRRFGESQIHLKRDMVAHKVQKWRVVLPSAKPKAGG